MESVCAVCKWTGKLKLMPSKIDLQAAKLVNANVSAAALFAVVFFLHLPAVFWGILTTPFDEIPRDDSSSEERMAVPVWVSKSAHLRHTASASNLRLIASRV